ncbi:GNAT family N-acetyltransferase [Actinokineospora sp. NPDC004072]
MAPSRPYRGPADLRRMQELVQHLWPGDWHIGDLAWQRTQHTGREPEWPTALWERDGEVVAWGWVHLPGHLALATADPALADEVLAWFAETATAARRTVTTADPRLAEALERNGYTRTDDPANIYHRRDLADLPEPVLPPGYTVQPSTDVTQRVAVHRVVWHPSRVTEESYRNVMATWPYRPELDWVAVAPDGAYAANCLIWLDERNRVGELEPVGTHPDHRGRGLGRAVCLAAMHALRDHGADTAVVYPVDSPPAHPGALALYRGLGFTEYARNATYVRSAG